MFKIMWFVDLKFSKYFSLGLMNVGLAHIIYSQINLIKQGGHNWGTGEWLINYGGGFIRRGLFGELLLNLPLSGEISLLILVFSQFVLYFFIWVFLIKFLFLKNFHWSVIVLICSPAGILFVSWDTNVFIRKELLGLVCLILLSISKVKYQHNSHLLLLSWVFYTFALLSGEINFVFLPSVIYLLKDFNNQNWLRLIIYRILYVFSTLVAIIFTLFFHGNEESPVVVCDKITKNGFDPNSNCRGAVNVLDLNIHDTVSHLLTQFPNYFVYAPILLLTSLPLFLNSWILDNLRWLLIIFLGVSPLFFIGWDYGRWIFIIYMQITICLISSTTTFNRLNRLPPLVIVAYLTVYGFGHTGDPINNGWIAAIPTTILRITN